MPKIENKKRQTVCFGETSRKKDGLKSRIRLLTIGVTLLELTTPKQELGGQSEVVEAQKVK